MPCVTPDPRSAAGLGASALGTSSLGSSGFGGRALVRTAGGQETIDVTLVAPVSVGDLVLVHAGAALTRPGSG